MDSQTMAALYRMAEFVPRITRFSAGDRVYVLDNMEDISGWSATNATLSADTINFFSGTQALKVTTTAADGTAALVTKNFELPMVGKYVKFWCHVVDKTKLQYIAIAIYLGDPANGNFYLYAFVPSEMADGNQWFDFHLDQRPSAKYGNPNHDEFITQITLHVRPVAGQTAEVTFDQIQNISRKPYIIFVNDGARPEFIDDVTPLLHQRRLPYQIQLTPEDVYAYYIYTDNNWPYGYITPPTKLRECIKRGANLGLHFDCRETLTDQQFHEAARNNIRRGILTGLINHGWHASALQGQWYTETRRNYIRQMAATLRRGSGPTVGWFSQTQYDGLHPIAPAPGLVFYDIPLCEIDHNVTEETVSGWITTAINNELGLYVFGHGTNRFQTEYRAPISVYQAFFSTYDANADKIHFLTMQDLYVLYGASRPDMNSRISAWAYRA